VIRVVPPPEVKPSPSAAAVRAARQAASKLRTRSPRRALKPTSPSREAYVDENLVGV
jgi:hypothetical protein